MANGMNISRKSLDVSRKLPSARRYFFAGVCLLWTVVTVAEELLDPTLPPPGISASVESEKIELNQSVGLQSILISKQRRAAIIDGKIVELGARVGEAKLIEVNESNVVLKTPRGRQVLTLYPDVNMTKNTVAAKQSAVKVRTENHPSSSREKK